MKKIKGLILMGLMLALSNQAFAAPKIEEILKQIDKMGTLTTDLTAQMKMTQQKKGKNNKVTEGIYYRRDKDNSYLLVLTAPRREKGNGYLKQGDNMWMYRRNTRTFQHINRDESIAGTDVSSEDLEHKKLTLMYKPVVNKAGIAKIVETKLGKIPVYQFQVIAKIENVKYRKKIYWVRKDNYVPLKIQSFSLNGALMETAYYLKYTQLKGKYFCLKMMLIDEFEKGNRTLVDVVNVSLKKIDNSVFTKGNLENLSK